MIHRVLSASALVMLGVASLTLMGTAPRAPEVVPMLSGNIVPISYDLTIAPITAGVGFGTGGRTDGDETVVVRVKQPTNAIALNASGTSIADATIDDVKARVSFFPIAQQVIFASQHRIMPGLHELHVRFQSTINGDTPGFWSDSSDAKAPNLVTDFEPASARALFPCFDEPQYRAKFTMHVVAPDAWTVIANMPLTSKSLRADGRAQSNFQQTPPMPTYLLTLDMGKFTHVSAQVGPTPVTVYARPGKEALAQAVLTSATASMNFFEKDLGVAFPLPKLDIVIASGVLNDAEQGYGAITVYTEYEVSGQQFGGELRGRENAFSIIASSISDQWLGDLVSPSWWSEAWVTYGFSASEELRAERALHPEFSAVPNDIDWGWMSAYDAHAATSVRRAITDDRGRAAWQGLNERTFSVGPAMLDMWRAYVGEDRARRVFRKYLSRYRNQAVSTDAFWNTFGTTQASAYEHAWLDQFGTPMLHASLRCEGNKQYVVLSQRPIHASYSNASTRTMWPIPVRLRVGMRVEPFLFATRTATVSAGTCATKVALNEGLRPPYMTTTSHIGAGNSATDRLRIFSDTQYLYDAHLATVTDLNAALASYAPNAAGLFRLRYAFRDLIADAMLLRGSSEEARYDDQVRSWAIPLDARTRTNAKSIDASTRGTLRELLSWMPDSNIEKLARATFAAQTSQAGWFPDQWGNSELAAQGAAPAAILDMLQQTPQPDSSGTFSARESFLLAAAGDDTITSVLNWASKRSNFAAYVAALGARNPRAVSGYLELHARDLIRSVPPSQQAWTLTSSVVNGAWSSRSPQAWRSFFERYLAERDRSVIANAVNAIAAKWAQRHQLEQDLRR